MWRGEVYRPGTTQSVAYTGTEGVLTDGFGSQTRVVRLTCTTSAYVEISKSPTATTADVYVPAEKPEYFIVRPGEKAAAIQVSAGGTLYVTEMS